jgi:hypothetical protein
VSQAPAASIDAAAVEASAGADSRAWPHRHLLDTDVLTWPQIELVMDTAAAMAEIVGRGKPRSEALRGVGVTNLFYEASTRTRVSFEVAAKHLSADVVNVTAGGSSVEKGESLLDTMRTLEALGARVLVIRHALSGAPYLVAREFGGSVINAGDGRHAHPTQALLDLYTLRQHLFWLLNSLTILLFIFGALAVLYPRGIVPNEEMLIWDEAMILAATWGPPGRVFFLIVGAACLFSTQLTLVDGVSRSCADIIHTNFAWARRWELSTWYARIAAGWIVAGIVLTYVYESLPAILFLMGAGFFGGIAMAIYTPLTLFINVRHLPPAMRPSRLRIAIMLVLSLFYGVFAVVAVIQLLRQLLA